MKEGLIENITNDNIDDFLTKKQASKSLGVSIKTIESWTKSGKLPATKVKNSRGQNQSLYHISDIQKCQSVTPVPIKEEQTNPFEGLAEVENRVQQCIEISTSELNLHTQALAALLQKQNELIVHLSQQINSIPKDTSQQIQSTVKGAVSEITTNNEQTIFAIGQIMEQDKVERKLEREEESLERERLELKREERDIEITNMMKQSMAAKEKITLANRMKAIFTIPAVKEAKLQEATKLAEKKQLKEQLKAQSRTRKRARHVAPAGETPLSLEG